MKNIIEIKDLNKTFKEVKAVQNLSFNVKQGELFAFLGVNGAGKSTTINIMCGQLSKDNENLRDYSICSRVPTGEPYAAHNINEKFDEFEKKKEEEIKKAEKEDNNGVVNQ